MSLMLVCDQWKKVIIVCIGTCVHVCRQGYQMMSMYMYVGTQ